jgi:PGF-CTERM protein
MISDQAYPLTQISTLSSQLDKIGNDWNSSEEGSSTGTPGFEILSLLVAIGTALILLRRRK